LKRVLDVVVAGSALIALSPILLAVAACIKATDGGPVLFWQERVGKDGRSFPFPKLRSMVVDAEARLQTLLSESDRVDGVTFKMREDPRITWIGRWIRRFSVDEMPQLLCVLRGDMTLVGPRPPVPREVALYTLDERQRLEVTPGLTCFWQVNGRAELPFTEQVELDLAYIHKQSFGLDLWLLMRTVPAVLGGRGAY
jgi:lipopolysaccharide/colanic/teichoic acid biosynthesis glycosyltransferase